MRLPALVLAPALALAIVASCSKAPDVPATAPPVAPMVPAAPTAPTAPAPEVPEVPDVRASDADRTCSADGECALVPEDCCGCNALGKLIGVRADKLAALGKRREPICSVTSCAAAMSDDPSCAASKAVCRAGVCVADVPGSKTDAPKTEPIPPG